MAALSKPEAYPTQGKHGIPEKPEGFNRGPARDAEDRG
jgi:hypothetical protein